MEGLQQRSVQESLEYLALAATHLPKVADLLPGANITAQLLANAGGHGLELAARLGCCWLSLCTDAALINRTLCRPLLNAVLAATGA